MEVYQTGVYKMGLDFMELRKTANHTAKFKSVQIATRLPDTCRRGSTSALRRFFFLFESTSPRTYDPGLRFFVKQSSKQGEKQTFQVRFPAKMGLNSGEPSTRTAHALPCLHTQ